MKAKKCVAIVAGKAILSNKADGIARVFDSVGKARNFVANMIVNSVRIQWKDVEFITFG
jgi:hypothetical protein